MSTPDRYARQVFLKYAPPLQAVPLPSAQSIANQALQQQSGSSAMGLAQNVARVARPDTRVLPALPFNATRGGALALRPAQTATQIAARKTATQILMSPASLSGAREIAGRALQPAIRASGAAAGAIARTPVIGPSLRFVSRFVPKGPVLGVLTAITVIPDVMELFAPDVKNWLTGGWRGDGKGKGETSNVGTLVGSVNGAQYRLQATGYSTNAEGDSNPVSVRDLILIGPVRFVSEKFGEFPSLRYGGLIQRYSIIWIERNGAEYTMIPYFKGYPGNSLTWTLTRVDGTNEGNPTYKDTNLTSAPITQNPSKSSPSEAKPATDRANAARDAALLAAIATIAAGKYKPVSPNYNQNPTQNPARNAGLLPSASPTQPVPSTQPCKGNSCGQAGLDQATKNGQDLQTILDLLNAMGIGEIRKTVNRIDTKIGPQITDAVGNKRGLTEVAMDTVRGVTKIKDYLPIDRALNALTLAVTIHNAAMLSNSLGQTLTSTISNVLAALNIKDADQNPLDINKILSDSISGLIKNAIGAENYTSLLANWKKANRIYQASANLLSNVNSLRYSINSALEAIGGMNGKIGNALKRSGVVSENSYPWFNPSPDYDNKFMRGLETVEQFTSTVDGIAGEVLSAQESVAQIGAQKAELDKAIKEGTEKPATENDQQKAKGTASKAVSASPNIEPTDLAKPGGT